MADPTKTIGTTRETGLKVVAIKGRSRRSPANGWGWPLILVGGITLALGLFYHMPL